MSEAEQEMWDAAARAGLPVKVIDGEGHRDGILTSDEKGDKITPLNSWAPEVIADANGEWTGNALRFKTSDEANTYVEDLRRRWTLVTATRVVPSADPVNREIVDGVMKTIEPRNG